MRKLYAALVVFSVPLLVVGILAWALRSFYMPHVDAWLWDGTTPFVCAGNRDIYMNDKTADMVDGPLFDIAGNCSVTCENCTLKANPVFYIHGNGSLELFGGSVEATGTAFSLVDNGSATVNETSVRAVNGFVAQGWNNKIVLRDVIIEVSATAFEMGKNTRLDARNCAIKGATAIRADDNTRVEVRAGTLEGQETAIELMSNARATFTDEAKVVGDVIPGREGSVEGLSTL